MMNESKTLHFIISFGFLKTMNEKSQKHLLVKKKTGFLSSLLLVFCVWYKAESFQFVLWYETDLFRKNGEEKFSAIVFRKIAISSA